MLKSALSSPPSPPKEVALQGCRPGTAAKDLEERLKMTRRGNQGYCPVYQPHGRTSSSSQSRPPNLFTCLDPPSRFLPGQARSPTRSQQALAALGAPWPKPGPPPHLRTLSARPSRSREPLPSPSWPQTRRKVLVGSFQRCRVIKKRRLLCILQLLGRPG